VATTKNVEVSIDGHRVKLSNLDKVMYPAVGFTKGQVIDYYSRIGPPALAHLRGRALTLKRYPDGVEGNFFYEKQCPSHRPDWVRTESVFARGEGRYGRASRGPRNIDFCVVDDLATLVWVANLASLELHTSLAPAAEIEHPTTIAFDLDPGEPAGLLECARVACLLRDLFERLKLQCFPKTSGSKGIQVYVPLNTPTTYDATTPFAKAVAQLLEQEHRDLVVSQQKKELRRGKVLVDWSQNVDFKTTVSVYSLRARERPTVSTPLEWDEIEEALSREDADLLVFEADDVLERAEQHGDLFAPVAALEQTLPEL
jgi:bifunctional non-homologous end joining protein LigD